MKIKIGVVGYGYWGPNLVRNLASHPKCSSVTVCETDERKRNLVLNRFQAGNVNATADFQDILNDEEISGVVIATPISTHFELAKKALENGKHVFAEKPLAHEGALAHELVDMAKDRNLKLMVGHTFLFSPPVLKAKEILTKAIWGMFITLTHNGSTWGCIKKTSASSGTWDPTTCPSFSSGWMMCPWRSAQKGGIALCRTFRMSAS